MMKIVNGLEMCLAKRCFDDLHVKQQDRNFSRTEKIQIIANT